MCFFLILWRWCVIFPCHKWKLFFSLSFWWIWGICISLGNIFLRKKSTYLKAPAAGNAICEAMFTFSDMGTEEVPEEEEAEAFVVFPLPTSRHQRSSMGMGTSCKKAGVWLHAILPVAQSALGRKDGIPWSCLCHRALWGLRGRWGGSWGLECLSQQGRGAHQVCIAQGTWRSPWGGEDICVINILWGIGEDFLGSSFTGENKPSC